MAQQQATQTKKERKPLNGVDVPTLFATLDAVKGQPELADFTFRVSNRWVKATHSRSRMGSFSGAGGDHNHKGDYQYDVDHPEVLVGTDEGATPVEFVLHALAGCLTAGIGNIAAARGVELTEVESTIEGDIDLQGVLGLNDKVRNGYKGIRVSFKIKGDAPPEKLQEIINQSRDRSAVFDIITNQVPVEINVNAG
jgi:uncharacterized OsmC-like protein